MVRKASSDISFAINAVKLSMTFSFKKYWCSNYSDCLKTEKIKINLEKLKWIFQSNNCSSIFCESTEISFRSESVCNNVFSYNIPAFWYNFLGISINLENVHRSFLLSLEQRIEHRLRMRSIFFCFYLCFLFHTVIFFTLWKWTHVCSKFLSVILNSNFFIQGLFLN